MLDFSGKLFLQKLFTMEWNLPAVDRTEYQKLEKHILANQFMQLISQKMQANNLSRVYIAEKLGITPNYLSSLLTGKRIPTIELLAGFQYVLGIRFQINLLESTSEN